VHSLEQQYGHHVDFIHLDVDLPEVQGVRQRFDVRGRSHYVLVDPGGNVLKHWIGPLSGTQDEVSAAIETALASMSVIND
jgi:hypothetical protein